MDRRRMLASLACVLLLVAVTLHTYGFVLGLPFFSDDMAHGRFLQSHSFVDVWRTAYGLGYYRPLPASLWLVLRAFQKGLEPSALHALNLVLHLLNSLLLLALAVGGRRTGVLFGLGSALLFLLYPFSYQAVPWVGSLTHLLVTALILSCLLLFRAGWRQRSRWLMMAALLPAMLAPFAHETGVLAAPLLLGLLVVEGDLRLRAVLRSTWPFWLVAAGALGVWVVVPKGVSPVGLLTLADRWQNTVYMLQGLAYPVAPLALPLLQRFPSLGPLGAVALVSGVGLLLWGLFCWRVRRRRLLTLAVAWFALCVAPAWATLDPEYVQSGPRLLYLASIGAALFWATPLDLLSECSQVLSTRLMPLVILHRDPERGDASSLGRYPRPGGISPNDPRVVGGNAPGPSPAGGGRHILWVLGWARPRAHPKTPQLEPPPPRTPQRLWSGRGGGQLPWLRQWHNRQGRYERSPGVIKKCKRLLARCLGERAWQGVMASALGAAVVVAGVLGGYRFIREREPLYQQMRSAVSGLVAAQPVEADADMLCVNYPMWFALRRPTFALGHDGVVLVPAYSSVSDLLWLHTGVTRNVRAVIFADLLPKEDWAYVFPCYGDYVDGASIQPLLRQVRRVVVARYEDANVAVVDAGGLEAVGQAPAAEYQALFAGQVALLEARVEQQAGRIRVELRWQCRQPVEREVTVFLHLYDLNGALVAQADGPAVGGTSRLLAWQTGDVWRDVRILSLPKGWDTGVGTIKVGLYPVDGGPRLEAIGQHGERWRDEAMPIAEVAAP